MKEVSEWVEISSLLCCYVRYDAGGGVAAEHQPAQPGIPHLGAAGVVEGGLRGRR